MQLLAVRNRAVDEYEAFLDQVADGGPGAGGDAQQRRDRFRATIAAADTELRNAARHAASVEHHLRSMPDPEAFRVKDKFFYRGCDPAVATLAAELHGEQGTQSKARRGSSCREPRNTEEAGTPKLPNNVHIFHRSRSLSFHLTLPLSPAP